MYTLPSFCNARTSEQCQSLLDAGPTGNADFVFARVRVQIGFAFAQITGNVRSGMDFGSALSTTSGLRGVSTHRHAFVATTVAFFGKHAFSWSVLGRDVGTQTPPLIDNFDNFSADKPPWLLENPLLLNAADQSRDMIVSSISQVASTQCSKATDMVSTGISKDCHFSVQDRLL